MEKTTTERIAKIKSMREQGVSVRDIAKSFGITTTTVYCYLKQKGPKLTVSSVSNTNMPDTTEVDKLVVLESLSLRHAQLTRSLESVERIMNSMGRQA